MIVNQEQVTRIVIELKKEDIRKLCHGKSVQATCPGYDPLILEIYSADHVDEDCEDEEEEN